MHRKRKADTIFEISGGNAHPARSVIQRLHLDAISISTSKGYKRTTEAVKGQTIVDDYTTKSSESTYNFNWTPNDDFPLDYDQDSPQFRTRTASDDPMFEWLKHDREVFLDELLRCDGRGSEPMINCGCTGTFPAEFRCIDCLHCEMKCRSCIVDNHKTLPLHRIQAWNGQFFEKQSLKCMGLRIQLNHLPGDVCGAPRPAPDDDFVIVDTYQIHEVGLDFCNCEQSIPFAVQLLRAQLYPTTGSNPCSAVTFSCLKHFHLLSLESKCSVFEYMSSVSRGTDNTGTERIRDRYDEFLRVIRQWRHLKMLKRSGRGHDPNGVAATKPGECALPCPACPHPGRNLPPDWKSVSKEKK
ncbi:hypothetical protein H0H93_012418 [Arthromyces matolae]|nr:hypothetical protein H0H93_012418 [Arthromyces matolae]